VGWRRPLRDMVPVAVDHSSGPAVTTRPTTTREATCAHLRPVCEPGDVPSARDLREAARVLRKVVERTTGLPDDSPRDAQLRDRLELAADTLDAAARTDPDPDPE